MVHDRSNGELGSRSRVVQVSDSQLPQPRVADRVEYGKHSDLIRLDDVVDYVSREAGYQCLSDLAEDLGMRLRRFRKQRDGRPSPLVEPLAEALALPVVPGDRRPNIGLRVVRQNYTSLHAADLLIEFGLDLRKCLLERRDAIRIRIIRRQSPFNVLFLSLRQRLRGWIEFLTDPLHDESPLVGRQGPDGVNNGFNAHDAPSRFPPPNHHHPELPLVG